MLASPFCVTMEFPQGGQVHPCCPHGRQVHYKMLLRGHQNLMTLHEGGTTEPKTTCSHLVPLK